jgi:ribosomal protein L5
MARRTKRWSARVMRTSNALDLERGVFTQSSARAVARSLKRSAEHSRRRKSAPFRSAMSMLNFHINRAGHGMSRSRRKLLERAKDELRQLYGRKPHARKTRAPTRAHKSARR